MSVRLSTDTVHVEFDYVIYEYNIQLRKQATPFLLLYQPRKHTFVP